LHVVVVTHCGREGREGRQRPKLGKKGPPDRQLCRRKERREEEGRVVCVCVCVEKERREERREKREVAGKKLDKY
jgi:hypothetical protein